MAAQAGITDRTHDILRTRRRPMDAVFAPRSVAVIGASEQPRSAGAVVLHNLQAGFRGTIVPVTPSYQRLGGLDTYPSIGDAPGPVDLAIIATPAATVPAPWRATNVRRRGGRRLGGQQTHAGRPCLISIPLNEPIHTVG